MRSIHLRGIDAMAFVCGCGHTGTTLAATILSAHPQIYAPYRETFAFRGGWWVRVKALRAMRRGALAAGKRYIVEKTPRHIHRLRAIRRHVKGARFVIMVRDGRDVTASIARRHEGNFEAGLARWVADTGVALAERGKADVFILRYEDLVGDPPAAVRGLCDFLGVPYLDRLLEYHTEARLWFGQHSVERGTGVGHQEHMRLRNWQVNQPIFDGRGRWTKELPQEFVRRFETGRPREIMDAFGYAVD
jgi:hypothetical protein